MKFLLALLLTALLAFIAGLQFPWWSMALTSFLVALLVRQRAGKAFLAGFLGLFILWCGLSWWIDMKNESILSSKIGELLGVGHHPFVLILITGLIGGLVAGFAAMSGNYLRAGGRKE